jgi:arylsulfatase A-like enzyme
MVNSPGIADNRRPGLPEGRTIETIPGVAPPCSRGEDVFKRGFGQRLLIASALAANLLAVMPEAVWGAGEPRRPNILLIITDDQGYGDLGYHGNPCIRTPRLDRFARESVQLKTFCVSPVCSPTRASLMTGRYNYRTGVVDTYNGRSLMHPDETTLAEVLAAAGYRTGIFGKWHLGDNVPLRPIDQGFQRALVLKGGGIGQASDPPGGGTYQDPVLQDNGRSRKVSGYCSDIFTTAAIDFLSAADDRPFFAYLAFNCPHEPLQAPEAELAAYRTADLSPGAFPALGHPIPPRSMTPAVDLARVYAMITNIDANVGRILDALDSRGRAGDTIVIFLTDNGPAKVRFNAGLRGYKGTVYEGGLRVPCYLRWPGHFPAGSVVDRLAAHIDLFPTLLEACRVPIPRDIKLDGKSLIPLLRGVTTQAGWPDRSLFFQWHRGEVPQPDRAFAARSQRYKLLRREPPMGSREVPKLELYDLEKDPGEEHDIAEAHPDLVERMHAEYQAWFRDVSATRGFDPPRIEIGGPREDPTVLTRQDWRGPRAGVEPNDLGHWEVNVVRGGRFTVALRLIPRRFPTVVHVSLRGVERSRKLPADAAECTFTDVPWPEGPARLEAWVEGNRNTAGVLDVTVHRVEDTR